MQYRFQLQYLQTTSALSDKQPGKRANACSSGEVGPKSMTNVLSSIHEYDENVFWYWKLEEKRCNLTKQFVDIFHHQSVCC